jgi:hypothetical protein
MPPWLTKQDRQNQAAIISLLQSIVKLLEQRPQPKPQPTKRPAVLTEDQLDDIAEAAALSNGQAIKYEINKDD